VLWREVCTWAYGKKVVFIRFAYFVLFAFVAIALFRSSAWEPLPPGSMRDSIVPAAAKPLVPFLIVSLVIVNTLAVTSITSERDGRSLDLLLVTDLSPSEFMFGKLGGIFWVAREMVILPLLLCAWLWWSRVIATDEWVYLTVGMLLMNVFVATLGVHCGMIHANTRAAISVSSGTVFFLCLGVLICILMMISFSGSFQVQLAPFLAFILGGGVGLYVCLGARNPSSAIALASLIVPFATFYAVVSFLLQRSGFTFLVTVGAYGFSTAAMLVPALHEFDFAMGRTTVDDE
jgi:ABC-type Na+ efflux pump permease subunit